MANVARDFSFRYFAFIHHAHLRDRSAGFVNIKDYPPAITERAYDADRTRALIEEQGATPNISRCRDRPDPHDAWFDCRGCHSQYARGDLRPCLTTAASDATITAAAPSLILDELPAI
jgi:hypothetical protein